MNCNSMEVFVHGTRKDVFTAQNCDSTTRHLNRIFLNRLTLHHTKHHQAYVTGANAIFEKFDKHAKIRQTLM